MNRRKRYHGKIMNKETHVMKSVLHMSTAPTQEKKERERKMEVIQLYLKH